MKTIRRALLLFCWWAPFAHAADFTPVMIKGHPAHPTRILANVAPGSALDALATNRLNIVRDYSLVPGLMLLEIDMPAAVMSAATASASPATTPELQAHALQQRIESLRRSGLYEYVEPDYLVFADAVPNDSAFTDGTLWGLRNTGQNGGTAGVDIDAVRAWDITTGSRDVIVAVIDSGIRYTHQDLAANMWRNPGEIAGNGLDDDHNGYVDDIHGIDAINGSGDPMDDDGHGTHIAGTIGAVANGGGPHVGVAWSARLMACRFFNANGGGTSSDLLECYDYAVAHGADVLNCSFGSDHPSLSERRALEAARDRGVLVVAAAGNGGTNTDRTPHYPSAYDLDNIVAVAAIDRNGHLASFSNYGGRSVDLGAPGVGIYSTWILSDTSYNSVQGTSMAAPHVAGVAALVRAHFPDISVWDLRDRIVNTTTPVPSLLVNTASGGRVNAYQALTATGDGRLKLSISPASDTTLFHGRSTPVTVRVRDLVGVAGAVVTGSASAGDTLSFHDDGIAPDLVAGDANYTANLRVPGSGGQVSLSVSATASGMSGGEASATYFLVTPPVNDLFSRRVALSFTDGSVMSSNFGATLDAGEPQIADQKGGASIWWTWTTPADTTVTVSTEGSDFDTLLGVFTGDSVDALTEVASNDDIDGPNQPSRVTIGASAGTKYQIVVDGWEGGTGSVKLAVSTTLPPMNDNLANAISVSGSSFNVQAHNRGATREAGEPRPPGSSGAASIWWTWVAPSTGEATVSSVNSAFPSSVAVYLGDTIDTLTRVPGRWAQELGEEMGRIKFAAIAGTRYRIAVSSIDGQTGNVSLNMHVWPAPANDLFANATSLSGTSATFNVSSYIGTQEVGEPVHGPTLFGGTRWWKWTAPSDGTLRISTGGPPFHQHPLVACYVGSSLSNLVRVATNYRDDYTFSSMVKVSVVAGTTYHLVTDSRSTWPSGSGTTTVELLFGLAPANDRFANRIVLEGESVSTSGTTIGGTREAGEPIPYDFLTGSSLWWSWTSPRTGTAEISAVGIYPLVMVYTGDELAKLSFIPNSRHDFAAGQFMRLHVDEGVTYQIEVDGYWEREGTFTLSVVMFDGPANDQFDRSTLLSGSSVAVTGTNVMATAEPTEVRHPDAHADVSVWWTWTAPNDDAYVITTLGSAIDTLLTVYSGDSLGSLVELASNNNADNDEPTSRLILHTAAGEAYRIQVDSIRGEMGAIALAIFPAAAHAARIQPDSALPKCDSAFTLRAAVLGLGPFSYQWFRNGVAIAGATAPTLRIPSAQMFHSGYFTVRVSNSFGETMSESLDLVVSPLAPSDARLLNLSTRALGRSGEGSLIPGFVIEGDAPKRLLLRAVGPQLGTFGIAGLMPDPQMTLKRWNGSGFESQDGNNDWNLNGNATELALTAAAVGAFPLDSGSRDAALLVSLQPGQYTVVVDDTSGTAGLAMVEVYDADVTSASPSRLINLSNRGYVGHGADVMIPGFVISSEGAKTLLLRAVGPGLAQFGVTGVLADPKLTVYRAQPETGANELILANDNWGENGDAADITATVAQVGAFELAPNSADAAFVVTLLPGVYTVHASGADGGTGVALVELYVVE